MVRLKLVSAIALGVGLQGAMYIVAGDLSTTPF
jgi:hypothetical protein